mmetsp:Transcript_45064/g.107447  ORF Transcript_45064/g.107447 Transcript_45064/m.107447 type:complete len:229 (-) Transcript_45064:689-1375(-)
MSLLASTVTFLQLMLVDPPPTPTTWLPVTHPATEVVAQHDALAYTSPPVAFLHLRRIASYTTSESSIFQAHGFCAPASVLPSISCCTASNLSSSSQSDELRSFTPILTISRPDRRALAFVTIRLLSFSTVANEALTWSEKTSGKVVVAFIPLITSCMSTPIWLVERNPKIPVNAIRRKKIRKMIMQHDRSALEYSPDGRDPPQLGCLHTFPQHPHRSVQPRAQQKPKQ